MKLLFDQDPRLVDLLADLYLHSQHVQSAGLDRAVEETVWDYARQHGSIIVTKDTDFHGRGVVAGSPAKVVGIRRDNCSTEMISQILRRRRDDIQHRAGESDASYLVLI